MEKLTKECVLQSAARLEQESQDAVMRDIPQFFEAEIVTRFAGAVPQKKELNPLVFNMERGICLAETVDFLRECPALRPYDLILANELDSGCARSGERDTAAEIARALGMQYVFGLEFVELKDAAHGFHGNAIFSRWPILWAEVLRLPEHHLHRLGWTVQDENRAALRFSACKFHFIGGVLSLASVIYSA